MTFSIIAAVSIHDGAIGVTRDGVPGLPWPRLKHDLRWFQAITTAANPIPMANRLIDEPLFAREAWHTEGNAVIMGRRTWESLGGKPLAHRTNIALSTTSVVQWQPPDTMFTSKLDYALDLAKRLDAPHTFAIGGARLYAEALRYPACERLYLTEVDAAYPEADTHWPSATHMSFQSGIMHVGMVSFNGGKPIKTWHRTACSPWITETERPRYRFSVWGRA